MQHPVPSTIGTETALRLAAAKPVKFNTDDSNASFIGVFCSSHKISACHDLQKRVAARSVACMCGKRSYSLVVIGFEVEYETR